MRVAFALLLFSLAASAAPEGWHKNLDEARKAARKSGKPIFVATIWKTGI